MPKKRIRPLAVAIIENNNKIFVGAGYDEGEKKKFYRLMGGGIKFRETALQALKREFREEFAAELVDIRLLKVIENIYVYNGDYGHEIAYIFTAKFKDPKMYEDKKYPVLDRPSAGFGEWIEYNKSLAVYPQGVEEFLTANS